MWYVIITSSHHFHPTSLSSHQHTNNSLLLFHYSLWNMWSENVLKKKELCFSLLHGDYLSMICHHDHRLNVRHKHHVVNIELAMISIVLSIGNQIELNQASLPFYTVIFYLRLSTTMFLRFNFTSRFISTFYWRNQELYLFEWTNQCW